MSAIATPNEILAIVSEANRAPSVHNVQPARFEWKPVSTEITLYSDQSRWLVMSDPHRLDEATSLGAAWEGLRLALAKRGYELTLREWLNPALAPGHPSSPQLKRVATGEIAPLPAGAPADPLSEFVFKRKAFRGTFEPASAEALETLRLRLAPGQVAIVTEPAERQTILRLLSKASGRIASHRGIQQELLAWLRFNPSDERYHQDGLNAEALDLPRLIVPIASTALRLVNQPLLFNTGLNRVLIDESAVTRSASAIVILFVPKDADALTRGRQLYRTWLEITRAGLSACPMSVLADDLDSQQALRRFHPTPDEVSVLNVLRVGRSPRATLPLTPRLPPERLVIR